MGKRTPLYYTFGNHMHWVGMQWLWGHEVLPGSVRDMLQLVDETGARGNVNFDAVGYEKMAVESPQVLGELRASIERGDIEPIGCSYGQPYGLFHGGESNVRQFTHGVRTVQRLLGVRPKSFWEEEFYYFPQLPQLLRQCGYTGACLFFQWTWHSPELPKEPHGLVLWEGIDGTQIPTLPRNDLNVHQWPEDFDGLLDGPLIHEREVQWGPPAIVQWIELMPSRDWMCRSEVLSPRLKELMGDDRFDVRPRTCSQLIDELKENFQESPSLKEGDQPAPGEHPTLPVCRYSMDEIWHGVTLGKHGDRHPRTSRQTESLILFAESVSAVASLFGRPYPSWNVYPAWELDEAWRELLVAQHHDNHECESLCGFIGYHQMEKAESLAAEVAGRARGHLIARAGALIYSNPQGFGLLGPITDEADADPFVPPFGYADIERFQGDPAVVRCERKGKVATLTRGKLKVKVDLKTGGVVQLTSADCPRGLLSKKGAFLGLTMTRGDEVARIASASEVEVDDGDLGVYVESDEVSVEVRPVVTADAVDINWMFKEHFAFPDIGLNCALRGSINPAFKIAEIRTDGPFGAQTVKGTCCGRRKYPRGDWMTSAQWFEPIENAIHAHTWLDLIGEDGSGILIINNSSQQWFRTETGVEMVLVANDLWDGGRVGLDHDRPIGVRLVPHGPMTDQQRTRFAIEFAARDECQRLTAITYGVVPPYGIGGGEFPDEPDLPPVFGPLEIDGAPNVLAHAFFRESMKSGENMPDWAGHRMFKDSDGACDHPFAVRLVEWDGDGANVSLTLAGDVALAAKTNVMGETGDWKMGEAPDDVPPHLEDTGWLEVERDVEPPAWAIVDGKPIAFKGEPIHWSRVRFAMRPREIATVMADMVMGRKQWRDLDARRKVWATIHKAEQGTEPGTNQGADGG
jgi:alpha-mannosidase